MKISIIVARSKNHIIGSDNKLLWHLPQDLKFFKEKTLGHHMIMGRKTYESIGRPLPGRTTIIITRNKEYKQEGCFITNSLEEALDLAKSRGESEVMITGGGEIYREALPITNTIYLTEVDLIIDGDTSFDYNSDWKIINQSSFKIDEKHKWDFDFITLEK